MNVSLLTLGRHSKRAWRGIGGRKGGYEGVWHGGWIGALARLDSSWLYKNMKTIGYEDRLLHVDLRLTLSSSSR